MMQRERWCNNVAVLMGGPSAEREISMRSGAAAASGLRACGYEVTEVEVCGRDFTLPAGTEAVFIALHGTFGEDGEVQALLDGMGIPYTGSGAAGSQLAMDKVLAKEALVAHGIPTPACRVFKRGEEGDFPLPAVIKPARQGSSIGIHRIAERSQWAGALADAFRYDDTVLAEAYIPGRELTVGVVDGEALPVVEIVAPEGWYGFEAKYTVGRTHYRVPAEIPVPVRDKAQRLALEVFKALGCEGFGRVDFRMRENGDLQVLELNTIPGLTETSLLPKAAAAAGIGFADLCDRLLRTAGGRRHA